MNKLETKVELRFDILSSRAFDEDEKALLTERLANRIAKDGVLIMTSQDSRSQLKNKKRVLENFLEMIEAALRPSVERKAFKKLQTLHDTRLKYKHLKSELKESRKKPRPDIDEDFF